MQKIKGITFTNKDGNIIYDDNDTKDDIPDNIEITEVNENESENRNKDMWGPDITGVPTENVTEAWLHGKENENNKYGNTNDESGNTPEDVGNINDDEKSNMNDEYGNTPDDDKISIENESPEESHMNMSQINIDWETGEEANE